MQDVTYRSDVAFSFCCCLCSKNKDTLRSLEVHIWACHLREFPYRCSLCGYPSLTSTQLAEHYNKEHDPNAQVEFKRRVDQENKLRDLISQSVVFAVGESIYESDQMSAEEVNGPMSDIPLDHTHEAVHVADEHHLHQILHEGSVTETDDCTFEAIEMGSFHDNVVQEEIVHGDVIEEVIGMDDDEDEMAQTSYQIYEDGSFVQLDDDDQGIEYYDEQGNLVDADEFVSDSLSFHEPLMGQPRRAARAIHERHMDDVVRKMAAKPRRRPPTIQQCDVCGKVLKYPSKIAEHRRSHTGERPHVCGQCGASFSQKGALKCHVRLHTGEKPYPCTWECGRSFVSSSARQMHEKMHSGEKPFSCPVCMQLFGKKFHMQRHMASQHAQHEPDCPTGLDAAGEAAQVLAHTVTEVIENVRNAKLKKAKRLAAEYYSTSVEPAYSG